MANRSKDGVPDEVYGVVSRAVHKSAAADVRETMYQAGAVAQGRGPSRITRSRYHVEDGVD